MYIIYPIYFYFLFRALFNLFNTVDFFRVLEPNCTLALLNSLSNLNKSSLSKSVVVFPSNSVIAALTSSSNLGFDDVSS